MLDLALHSQGRLVTLGDISNRQQISQKYLWQIVSLLKAAGLVRASKGAQGGYALARPPSEVTLKDILDPLEGTWLLAEKDDRSRISDRNRTWVTHTLWTELGHKLAAVMRGITLKDLAEQALSLEQSQAWFYSI